METCLFTGEPLADDNRLEHTIPQALCGRVRARRVSSADFNRGCSNADQELSRPYQAILLALSPLLSSEHQPGAMDVLDTGGRELRLESGRRTRLRPRVQVAARDAAGRPRRILADESEAPASVLRHFGLDPSTSRTRPEPLVRGNYTWVDGPVNTLSPLMEVAALKCAMLTFDELRDRMPCAFTRSHALAPVRDFVRATLAEGRRMPEQHARHVMGLQSDRTPAIIQLRRTHLPLPETPFEHVLVATGNVATRCLDVVWLVLGCDPFGYRLSTDWRECDFTCTVACGILRGTRVHGPKWLGRPHYLCAPEGGCCVVLDRDPGQAEASLCAAQRRLEERRVMLYRQAVSLVECTCDSEVRRGLRDSAVIEARVSGGRVRVLEVVSRRLQRLFDQRLDPKDKAAEVDAVLGCVVSRWPGLAAETKGPSGRGRVSWAKWLRLYRAALARLEDRHGPAGEFVIGHSGVEVRPVEGSPR